MNEKIKHFIHKDGVQKFPAYNKEHNIHPSGTKRYANIGDNHLLPECNDLPKDGYPYTHEYDK